MRAVISSGKPLSIFIGAVRGLRKISSDLIFTASNEKFTLRSLNQTHSLLSLVTFMPNFFSSYTYDGESMSCYEIDSQHLYTILLKAGNPDNMVIQLNPQKPSLVLSYVSRYKVEHQYDLFIGNGLAAMASYTNNPLSAHIQFSISNLAELWTKFKRMKTIYLTKVDNSLRLTTEDLTQFTLMGSHTTKVSGNQTEAEVSLQELRYALKTTNAISCVCDMQISGPGQPVVIEAQNLNVNCLSILASKAEQEEEMSVPQPAREVPPEKPKCEEDEEEGTQFQPWPAGGIAPLEVPFPCKRRIIENPYAENSQPESDSDSDLF